MADDILSTIIGKPTGTTVVTVERGQLALFADAVKDDSPIYRDPRAAADAGLAGHPRPSHLPVRDGQLRGLPRAADGRRPRWATPWPRCWARSWPRGV